MIKMVRKSAALERERERREREREREMGYTARKKWPKEKGTIGISTIIHQSVELISVKSYHPVISKWSSIILHYLHIYYECAYLLCFLHCSNRIRRP